MSYLDERLCFALYSSSKAVVGLYQPYLNAIGITYLQYLIIIVLIEHGDQTVSQLGENLFLNSGTLTPALKRMESQGLIDRARSQQDERIVVVSLTEKARGLEGDIAEMQFEVSCSVGLDKTTFRTLRDELKALNSRLREKSQNS
ncbi:MAG: MarR family transcriptional regulator [Rhizobiaceae bacterium]